MIQLIVGTTAAGLVARWARLPVLPTVILGPLVIVLFWVVAGILSSQ